MVTSLYATLSNARILSSNANKACLEIHIRELLPYYAKKKKKITLNYKTDAQTLWLYCNFNAALSAIYYYCKWFNEKLTKIKNTVGKTN